MKTHKFRYKKTYRFFEHSDVWIKTNIQCDFFENDWIKVENGIITVKGTTQNGYAWDGCTPKIDLLDLCLGTPDGKTNPITEKPIAYYASLVHDAIYQFKEEIPIGRKDTDMLFKLILKDEGFFWSNVYYFFVRLFGPLFGKWITNTETTNLNFTNCSWKN